MAQWNVLSIKNGPAACGPVVCVRESEHVKERDRKSGSNRQTGSEGERVHTRTRAKPQRERDEGFDCNPR